MKTLNNTLFVTGTDTGVGKTCISRALVDYFVSQGERVAPLKPVASGSAIRDGVLQNDDALILMHAANIALEYSAINPYVFKEPIAPHIAAAKSQVQIDIHYLNQCHQRLADKADRVIVEGAGGWQVPLTKALSMADWVAQQQWPVILVVGLRLGCINHARLTYLDMMAKKMPLAGWVVNTIDADVLESEAIIADLLHFIKAPLLGVVPWLGNGNKAEEAVFTPDMRQYLDFSLLPCVRR